MAPRRRTVFGRFLALAFGGIVALQIHFAPSAFFASAPVPSEGLKTREPSERAGQAEKLLGPKSRSREAKYHLKVLVSFDDIKPFRGKLLHQLEKETQTALWLSGFGEYFPFSTLPRKAFVIAGDDKAGVLDALKRIIQSNSRGLHTFLVPKSMSGQLIGIGGEKLQALFAQSGARVNLQPSGFEYKVEVFAQSKDATLAVAEYVLNEEEDFEGDMRDHLSPNYLGNVVRGLNNECSIYLPMTDGQVAQLLGKGAETVIRVSNEFYVNISTPPNLRDKDSNRIVKIAGQAGDVHACHAYLLSRFNTASDIVPHGRGV